MIASSFWSPAVEAAPFTRDIPSFLQLGANSGAQSPAGSYATAQIDNVTLEMWVFLADTTGAHHAFFNGNGASSGYGIYLSGGTVNVLMGSVGWIVCSKGASYDVAQNAVLVAGRWMHIAATRNTTDGGTDGWKIYVDGQPLTTQFNTAGGGAGVPSALNASSYVQIGSATYDPAGLSVSEARIWERALTQAEIQANMSGTVALNASGLAGYWKFDQGTGSTVADLQTNKAVLNLPLSGAVTWVASTAGSTAEDTPLTGQLAGGDLTGSATYLKASDPAHGTAAVGTSGAYTYTPATNFNGSDTFSFKVNNGTADSATRTVNITVTAVNDAPAGSGLPTDISVTEDSAGNFDLSAVTLADPDSAAGSLVLTLTASAGKLSATSGGGVTVGGSGSGALTLTGPLADLNAFLDTSTNISYTGAANVNGNNAATVTVKLNDGGNTGAGGALEVTLGTVNVDLTAVNDAPTITSAPTLTTNEDTPTDGSAVAGLFGFSDVDLVPPIGMAITGWTGKGTWRYSFTGAEPWISVGEVSDAQALLLPGWGCALRYQPDNVGGETATLTFRAWDHTMGTASTPFLRSLANVTTNGGNTAFSATTAQITVNVTSLNDAPTATNLTQSIAYTPGANAPIADIAVTEVDAGDAVTVTLTLSPLAAGSLTFGTYGSVTSTYNAGTGVWVATGAVADVNAALAAVAFSPAAGWNQSATITTQIRDAAGTGPAVGSITLTANDVPAFVGVVTTLTVDENSSATSLKELLHVSDTNNGQTLTWSQSAAPAHGALAFSSATAPTGSSDITPGGTIIYTPAADYWGNDSFTVQVSDGTASATRTVQVTVNPVAETPTVTNAATNEDVQTTAGLVVTRNVADGSEVTHFKITAITNGRLYQNNGTTEIPDGSFITVTEGAAGLKFTPDANENSTSGGPFTFAVQAGTDALGGGLSPVPATATITVTAVNDAPVLDNSKSPTLAAIAEDTGAPTAGSTASSTLVSSLVDIGGSLGNVTDPDSGAAAGIAVVAISGHGTLYYTTDGGTTWHAAGTVSASSALLLAADANTRIAFVPQANLVGTDTDAITFKAWDRTSGSNGATGLDTGAGSAFSMATDTASVVITSVNDAPTIDAATYTLAGTDENTTPSATQIATIAAALNYSDVDSGAIIGVAVTGTTGNGTWEYSTDGVTGWTAFGTVDASSALLVTSGTYVRFVPDNKNGGTATFAFRAWDRTVSLASDAGTPRYADTSTNGGTSQFSTAQANASMTVSSVNDAPVFVGAVTSLTVNENTGATNIKALLHASDPDNTQTLTWTESTAPAHGTLTFSDATAASPGSDMTPGGTITYTPTANYVGSDTFTIQVSDGTASATRTISVTVNVVATELRFTTQPSGSISGMALAGQPVVKATDASGNVDPTFTGNVTLSLGSGAGSLSGTLTKPAVAGVATFTDLAYTATADQQSFTLTTANTAGLTEATSSAATSDVVATKLRFATQPAPLAMASTFTRMFTTAPVVQAVDATNVVDTGYPTAIMLSLTKSDGSAAPGTVNSVSGPGDTDGSGTTVTLASTSGGATFSGLNVRYTNSAVTDSLALHATSGSLTSANSAAISSRIDIAPTVDTLTSGGSFSEGGAAVVVSSSVTVTDADDSTCAWAAVSITLNFTAGQDVLSFTNNGTTMGNIAAAYDAATGVLTLTSAGATATRAQWAAALGAVKYSNTSEAPNTATRQMLFVVNDGFLSSASNYGFAMTNVTVTGTNDAPTLAGGPFVLAGTDENTISSATAVSTILAGLTYADPDGSVASGIAITQKTGTGSWVYSTDGVTWAAVGTVSNTSALLLTSTSRIRYAPVGAGGETATITFRGWDRTSGTASTNSTRGLVDASVNGGTTAFSAGTAQATMTVAAVDDPPPAKDAQTITFGALADAVLGQTVMLSASASSGLPVSFSLVSGPATLSGSTVTCTGIGTVTVRATQAGNGSYDAATAVVQRFTVGLPIPTVTTPTQVPAPAPGGTATLTVPTPLANATYRWQRNGADLTNATSPTLALANVQPPAAGLYTYTASTAGGTAAVSEPVIVGVATEDKVTGTGERMGADIHHPNGNVYDQLILEGAGATFTAEPAQVTRMSYVDLSGDIVQVEFSGAGSLSLVMDDAGTPAPAANYNQPGVNYVRGNPGIVITGADETTNVSVISVGRINAVNQALFRDDVAYDGVANIAFIAIQSTNGQFGGVRTGNVEYFAAQGFTGVYAPGVTFNGPVNIGDIQAHDDAQPLLVVGSAANVRIAGGSLAQPNGQPIRVDGLTQVTMAPGQTSQGGALPAQANQGILQQDGIDVTDLIVVGN